MATKTNLERLKRAQSLFEQFRKNMLTERDKAGAVQAFEFCYELCWKTIKKLLESEGLEVATPKDAFRKAATAKLIQDPELWFDFQKKRNLTVHTYEEETLEEVLTIFDTFSVQLQELITQLEGRI